MTRMPAACWAKTAPAPPPLFSCRVALQIGTLSKGIGALGGYVACSQDMKDYLLNRARPVLFSTSHPPSVVATCIAALDILESDNSLVERLWENTSFFKKDLEQLGF